MNAVKILPVLRKEFQIVGMKKIVHKDFGAKMDGGDNNGI